MTRYGILILIMAAQTLANVGPLGIPAIASIIRADLGLTLTEAGSFLSAYYIGPILVSMPAGGLADRWGVKRTLVLGQVVIALGLVAVAGARSYVTLIVLLSLAGFGYGFLNPTSTKAVMTWFPPRQRATVVGLKQVGLPFGGMLGAALLPALAVTLGWRAAVIVAAALIATTAVASLLAYRDPPDSRSAPCSDSPRAPDAPATRPGRSFATVLVTRDLWLVAAATGVFAAMQTIWMAFLVLYLQSVVGLPLLTASRYLAMAQLGGMAGRVAFGVLSDRAFGGRRRAPLAIAGAGSALCSLAIAGIGPDSSVVALTVLALVFGVAGIGWNGVQHTLMAELAGPGSAATAVGFGLAVSSLGVTLGPPIFGWLVERAGSYTGPWIGLALTMVVALAVLTLVRERPRLV